MILLKKALGDALKSVRLGSVGALAKINSEWTGIVGEQLARVCEPSYIKENRLMVNVFDPAFMEPVQYARLDIADKIRGRFGPIVNEIAVRFRQREPGKGIGKLSKTGLTVLLLSLLASGCATFQTGERIPREKEATIKSTMDSNAYFNFLRAEMLMLENKPGKALEAYREALKHDSYAMQVYLAISRILLRMGDFREATDVALNGLVFDPEYMPLHTLLGGIYSSSKNYKRANYHFKKIIQKDADRHDIRLYLAINYIEIKKYDEAEEELAVILEKNPQSQMGAYYLSRIYVTKKLYGKAEEFLTRLVGKYPSFPKAYETLGWVYVVQEKYDRAIDIYEKYLSLNSGYEPIKKRLANVYLLKKSYGKALDVYKELEKNDPGTLDISLRMGILYYQKGEYNNALEKFQLVRLKDPDNETAPYYIARSYEELGMYDESISEWKRLAKFSKVERVDIYVHISGIYERLGQLSETEKMLQKAITLSKDDAELFYLLGVVQVKKEEYNEALQSIQEAIKRDPARPDFIFHLGATYEKLKKYDKSIEAMKRAIELDPKHSDALNYIGYLYAEKNINLGEALEYLKRALELEPNNGYYLDSLGWIYYKQGRYGLALEAIKDSISYLEEKDHTVLDHLGDVYSALGRYEEAVKAYADSLQVEENAKVEEKLHTLKKKFQEITVSP